MAQSKNRLGRGLGGLISGGGVAQAKKAQETVSPATKAKAKTTSPETQKNKKAGCI